MKRDRENDGHRSGVSNGKQTSPSTEPDGSSAFEAKRLSARRRILKAGVGGAAAVILSVHQRRSEAAHEAGNANHPAMSVECDARGGQKVGVSLCMSITNRL